MYLACVVTRGAESKDSSHIPKGILSALKLELLKIASVLDQKQVQFASFGWADTTGKYHKTYEEVLCIMIMPHQKEGDD